VVCVAAVWQKVSLYPKNSGICKTELKLDSSSNRKIVGKPLKIKIAFLALAVSLVLGGCSHFSTETAPASQNQSEDHSLLPDLDSPDKNQALHQPPPIDEMDEQDQLVGSGDEPTDLASDVQQLDSDGARILKRPKKEQSMLDEALDLCDVAQSYWQKGELESALEALDKAYSLILDVDLYDAKLIQQKEDLRFLISKRILEIYASRNIVVNGNHNEIPLEMNPHVEAELRRFTGPEKNFFEESYRRSQRYRPYILEALKNAGLPEELSWLPLIESGYKVKALSRARALGLWQFIPSTGYKFGLKRNQFVDERIDVVKSTHAAIAYLRELHAIFGDWMTVLAAYNCGEGRVLRVIRSQNVNYLDNFWDLYQRLPSETARYVPRFLATLHMVKNAQQYGLDQLTLESPMQFEEIEINRQVHLKDVSAAWGIDLEELKQLNPELRYQILPPEQYHLKIPPRNQEAVLLAMDTIPVSHLPQHYQRESHWHRVRSGETLSSIARRYKMSLKEIMTINNLKRSALIRVGQNLRVSRPEIVGASSSTKIPPKYATGGTHKVRQGDSLFTLAKRYNTTVEQIKSVNGLSSNMLYIGQTLKVPSSLAETVAPTARKGGIYSVKQGDSPFTIAQKHNMQLDRFLRLNQLSVSSKIFPGQQVYID
jgi:membrane-bound lytic murein transglycosylase D